VRCDTVPIPTNLSTIEQLRVRELDCATQWGNEGLLAFSTPALLGHMERTSVRALEPHLDPEQMTVGLSATLKHLAPTPVGAAVQISVKLLDTHGKRLVFSFEAWDADEKIGEGVHERFVVSAAPFRARLERKRAQLAGSSTEHAVHPAKR
jgi:fluoroacetyl-CoA thioesterase